MLVQIPITDPTQRSDGTALTPAEIKFIDILQSIDGGQTYDSIGHAAADQPNFQVDLPNPGTYLFKADAVDTQSPVPHTSADSNVVSFTVPVPELAAPNPPVLGTPVKV